MNTLLVARLTAGRTLRRTALVLGLCAAALGSLALTTPARASDAQFMGHWFTVDPSTRDLVRSPIAGIRDRGQFLLGTQTAVGAPLGTQMSVMRWLAVHPAEAARLEREAIEKLRQELLPTARVPAAGE